MIGLISDMADVEVSGFMNELKREHEREIERVAKPKEYSVYRRGEETGEQIILLPPEVMHLVKRMTKWLPIVHACTHEPNLVGCKM